MNRRRAWRIAAGCALLLILSGCGSADEKPSPETAALTINGETISLREYNFYLRMNQMQWEKSYMEDYGDEMWSRQVPGYDLTFAQSLHEQVLDTIVQNHIIDQHAEDYGAKLSDEVQEELREKAGRFMEDYDEGLLDFAGADADFVYGCLCDTELSALVAQEMVADYEPELSEEDYYREGICYVLLSTTGTWDEEDRFTPYSEEELARRERLAGELSVRARESGSLEQEAEAEGFTPIESSMGRSNEGDGQNPDMLDAARALEVGGVSDPIRSDDGWLIVQHTSSYDEDGTAYWKDYLTGQAREARCGELYEEWKAASDIEIHQEAIDTLIVKDLLKELL